MANGVEAVGEREATLMGPHNPVAITAMEASKKAKAKAEFVVPLANSGKPYVAYPLSSEDLVGVHQIAVDCMLCNMLHLLPCQHSAYARMHVHALGNRDCGCVKMRLVVLLVT